MAKTLCPSPLICEICGICGFKFGVLEGGHWCTRTASKQSAQPLRNPLGDENRLSALELGHFPEGSSEIFVVENQNRRKCLNRHIQVGERARKPTDQFLRRDIVPALGYAHGNAFLRRLRSGNPDEAEYDVVARSGCVCEESKFVTYRIGEYRLKHKALAQSNEFASKGIGQLRRIIGGNIQFSSDIVGIDEAQPGFPEVRMKERRFSRAVWTRDRHNRRAFVQGTPLSRVAGIGARLEPPIDKAAKRAASILAYSYQQSRMPGSCFIMWERT